MQQIIFGFLYGREGGPDVSPFKDLFAFEERWYSPLALSVVDYRDYMKPRSEKWGTVCLPAGDFRRLAKPFEEWL